MLITNGEQHLEKGSETNAGCAPEIPQFENHEFLHIIPTKKRKKKNRRHSYGIHSVSEEYVMLKRQKRIESQHRSRWNGRNKTLTN